MRWRRTTKIGPFRITASHKGMGWSVGGLGLRYGRDVNGRKYMSASANGVTSRKMLQSGTSPSQPVPVQGSAAVPSILMTFGFILMVIGMCASSMFVIGLAALMIIGGAVLKHWGKTTPAISAGDYDKAQRFVMEATKTNDPAEVLALLQEAHLADPTRADVLVGMADVLDVLGRRDEAEEARAEVDRRIAKTKPPPLPRPASTDPSLALTRLADLRDRGVLTEEEFQEEKRRILSR